MSILSTILYSAISRQSWCLGVRKPPLVSSRINLIHFREELFYQLGLRQFGDFSRIKLEPPPSLRDLVEIGVAAEEISEETTLSKPEIVDVRPI